MIYERQNSFYGWISKRNLKFIAKSMSVNGFKLITWLGNLVLMILAIVQ